MRTIDADALLEQYGLRDATKYGNENAEQQQKSYSTLMMYEIADMIYDAPTIEPPANWTPCSVGLPESGKAVLFSCKTEYGTEYVCDGYYAAKFSIERDCDMDEVDNDYDEETDTDYIPEGFYESVKNWDDYGSIFINDTVVAWCESIGPFAGRSERMALLILFAVFSVCLMVWVIIVWIRFAKSSKENRNKDIPQCVYLQSEKRGE